MALLVLLVLLAVLVVLIGLCGGADGDLEGVRADSAACGVKGGC